MTFILLGADERMFTSGADMSLIHTFMKVSARVRPELKKMTEEGIIHNADLEEHISICKKT